MNISQMMRSLLGDVQSGDSKKLELKPGQVVRGIVTQMQGDQEAVVQINGVQVRAKLETPVVPGQSTMLKVQPESTPELIVLKPVDSGNAAIPDDTVRQLAKSAGLPDAEWAMNLIKQLKRDGIPMTREVAQAIKQAYESMPHGADPEEWMQAATAALKRGMPMTEQSVAAMRQVMFGKPLHELMDTLNKQLGDMKVSKETAAGGSSGNAQGSEQASLLKQPENALAAALRVKALLTQTVGLSSRAADETVPLASNQATDGAGGEAELPAAEEAVRKQSGVSQSRVTISNTGEAMEQLTTLADEGMDQSPAVRGSSPQGNFANARTASAGEGGSEVLAKTVGGHAEEANGETELPKWIGRMLTTLGVSHEHKLLQAAARQSADQTAAAADLQQSEVSGGGAQAPARTAASADANAAGRTMEPMRQPATAQAATAQVQANAMPIGGMSEVEDGIGAAGIRPGIQTASMPLPLDGKANAGAPLPVPVSSADGMDTLKSALLSLAAMDDTPASVRETAQQLIHQITGQQLMLAPERSGSLLTHVTLFIPLYDQNGGQTASVHIQTRRGGKNELDASNCRLLFDLNLRVIGDTLVDVHVVDKIVNLNVWNDHPVMQRLIEEERGAVAEALQRSGYQLLTFKVKPLPDESAAANQTSNVLNKSDQGAELPPVVPPYGGTPYKGVDYRI